MLNILIVDDNQEDREGLRDFIKWQELGFNAPVLARDGLEGLAAVRQERPDIVISDIAMPHMNGLQMVEALVSENICPKVIFISCFDEFEYVRHAIELHSFSYILKPIELDKLSQALLAASKDILLARSRQQLLEELGRKAEINLAAYREKFFRDLYFGLLGPLELGNTARNLGLGDRGMLYAAVCLGLHGFEEAFAAQTYSQKLLILQEVRALAFQRLSLDEIVLLEQRGSMMLLLLCCQREDKAALREEILLCADGLCASIASKLGLSATVSLGEITGNVEEIEVIANTTAHLPESSMYSKIGSLLLDEGFSGRKYPFRFDPAALQEILTRLLESQSDELPVLPDIPESLPGENCRLIAYAFYDAAQKNFDTGSALTEQLKAIAGVTDIPTLRQWLRNLLCRQRAAWQEGGGRIKTIADDLERAIRRDFMHIGKVEDIVQPFLISASHANAIFRRVKGYSLYDCLMSVRLERARELLQNPYAKVYEVAQQLGYESTTYFSTMFKEHTGMTPRQYANQFSPRESP